MEETLKFTVDSALLRELGEKLVETVHIALVELVKNSYDADATEVEILFTEDRKGKKEIHVIDNGKGMNHTAVQDYWMRIATTNKEEKDTSAIFGRYLTGAKGIGRFSCRRLGGHLTLITKGTEKGLSVGKQRKLERTEVVFPWTHFKPGTDVTNIKCKGSVDQINNETTGTTLIISDISEEWNTRGWNWLKRQLGVLAANQGAKREGYKNDPGFTIKITAPDFEGGVRDLRQDILNAGWGTLTAKLNKNHQAVCELEGLGIGKRTITSTQKFTSLNDISLKLGIMVMDREQMRETSNVSIGNLSDILPSWGGVQIRYRNFRVFPYGDDDWLDIDHDRGLRKGASRYNELTKFADTLKGVDSPRALLNMLSMRNYLGSVSIGEDAKGFEMKLNREGFVRSKSVDELKEFVRFAIDWSTILRDYYLRQESLQKSKLAAEEFEKVVQQKLEPVRYIESAISYIENEVRNLTDLLPEFEKRETKEAIFKATDVIAKQNETNKAELLHLRLVASTSTLLLIFSHEVKSLLGLLEQSKTTLKNIASQLPIKQKNQILKVTSDFNDLKVRLEGLLDMTSLVGVEKRNLKRGQIALKDKLAKVENVFSLILTKYEITLEYGSIANNIVIKDILEAEVYSIFLNVISNSIKSVIAAGKNRKIDVSAIRSNGVTLISVKDTGIGLSRDSYEEVFVPFISDPKGTLYESLEKRLNPEDKLIVGSGSGLGLGIVKEIITAREGSVSFVTPSKGWNAELLIKLP